MAITVKHSKVSTIPDDADTSLVRPSDWNADHTLTGTIEVANGGTGQTTANAAFNALAPSQAGNTGKYLTTDGTNSSWSVNPLGTVTSVAATAGTGISVTGSPITTSGTLNITNTAPDQTVVLTAGTGISTSGTYPNFTITNTSPSLGGDVVGPASATDNAVARFDTTTGKLLQNSVVTVGDTGAVSGVTTLAASTSVTTPIVQATNSAGLALRNSAGTSQLSVGAGGGDNVTISVATNINGANAQIDISPTGTGHVHIKPTGTGSLEIAPTNAGTMNNMVIGGVTPLAITGTTITATSFVGSGASLTNVVNSLAASTGISVSGSTGAVTVTNTAPDQTVALASGTGISVTGTYPNFTVTNTAPSSGGTVTSVTGTAPIVSSGGNTPAISLAASYGDTQNPYASKTANFVLAAPNGSAGAPTFRAVVAADIPTLNQNTTGSAATLTTARNLWGQSFNGSADISAPLYPALGTVSLPAYSASGDTNTGIFFPAADTIAFTEGGAESMRITSSAQLSVNTANWPTSSIGNAAGRHIFGGSNPPIIVMWNESAAAANNSSQLYLGAKSGTSSTSWAGGSILGAIVNNTDDSGYLAFSTTNSVGGNIQHMRITDAGLVGIGTSSPTSKLDVSGEIKTLNDAVAAGVLIKRTGGVNANGGVNFVGSDDAVDASVRMAIDVANTLTFTTGGTTERMRITNAGEILIGKTSATANGGDLQVSSGITFPATQVAKSDANTLDDYEEGTWTPVLRGGTTAGTYTYDTDRTGGNYTKIGNTVLIRGVIRVSGTTSAGSGSAQITGLPFATVNPDTSWGRIPSSLAVQSGPILTNSSIFVTTEGASTTYLTFGIQGLSSWTAATVAEVATANSIWFFQLQYNV